MSSDCVLWHRLCGSDYLNENVRVGQLTWASTFDANGNVTSVTLLVKCLWVSIMSALLPPVVSRISTTIKLLWNDRVDHLLSLFLLNHCVWVNDLTLHCWWTQAADRLNRFVLWLSLGADICSTLWLNFEWHFGVCYNRLYFEPEFQFSLSDLRSQCCVFLMFFRRLSSWRLQ